jgi:hypothetical protein
VGTDSSGEFELATIDSAAQFEVDETADEAAPEAVAAPEPTPAIEETAQEDEESAKEKQQRTAQQMKLRYEWLKKEEEKKKAQAAAYQAKVKRKKRARSSDDDDDEPFHVRWRKQLISLAAAASVLFCLWYGWRWYKTPYRPPTPLQAEAVWELFKTDPIAANRKYENKRFFIRGKLFIEKKVFNEPQRAFFKLPNDEAPRLRCTFASVGEMVEEGSGETRGICIISGEFQPYLDGPVVEITQCEFLGSSPVSAAGASALGSSVDRQLVRSLGDSADLFAGPGARFRSTLTRSASEGSSEILACASGWYSRFAYSHLAPEATYAATLPFGLVRSDALTQCQWAHHRRGRE